MIHQIIPIVREDHERVVVLISNGSSHTLSALQKTSQTKRIKNLPNRIAYLIVVFIHIVLISKIFALLIEFFGQRVSIWNQDESKDTRTELPSECSIDHNDR